MNGIVHWAYSVADPVTITKRQIFMQLIDLVGLWKNQPALIVAGGPDVDECAAEHLPTNVIGTNYAHRIWNCDFVIPVKDYIYEEIRKEVPPFKIIAPANCKNVDSSTILWDHELEISNIIKQPTNKLYTGKSGSTGGAIHLAHILGANPIFMIGVDLNIIDDRYHSKGYWDTVQFKPMGWRQKIEDLDRVFNDQAIHLNRIINLLNTINKKCYFIHTYHWRMNNGNRQI